MTMKKKAGAIVLASAIALPAMTVSSNAVADANPWQDCGLGAMVFPENGMAAAISNLIWDLGTTALSSALSSPEQCQGENMQAAAFINAGYAYLEEDTAAGQGDYASALMNIYGCEASSHDEILSTVQDGFSEQLSDEEYANLSHDEKAYGYYDLVDGVVGDQYAGSCTAS